MRPLALTPAAGILRLIAIGAGASLAMPGFAQAPALVATAPAPAVRPVDQAREPEAVAFHLVVFLKYVLWPEPPAAGEPWRVGLLGRSDIPDFNATIIRMLSAKPAMDGRRIEVVSSDSADKLLGCQIVLINPQAAVEVAAAVKALAGRPVLTVTYRGRKPAVAATGAAVELAFTPAAARDASRGRMIFHLNKDAFTAQGLRPTPGLVDTAAKRPAPANTDQPSPAAGTPAPERLVAALDPSRRLP